jgi:nicotinamidase-related amidase
MEHFGNLEVPEDAVLVVIDVQKRWPHSRPLVHKIRAWLKEHPQAHAVQLIYDMSDWHFSPGDPLIAEYETPYLPEIPIIGKKDDCDGSNFLLGVKGTLYLAGVNRWFCVRKTAKGLWKQGREHTILEDLCADDHDHPALVEHVGDEYLEWLRRHTPLLTTG